MSYRTMLAGQVFTFQSIKEVLAKANEEKSGDVLAGVAASSAIERIAAKEVLADMLLCELRENPVVPYEEDEVTRLNQDSINETIYREIRGWTVAELREWILDYKTTEEDIRRLFCIEASAYWRTHHIPGIASDEHPKRLGAFKANIIGINLVSVLQFAYGSVTGRETLRDSALTLLERLPAEDNRYMRNWRNTGVSIRNAFESQALLQLATEYCPAKRCTECPVGRRILQSISSTE